MGVFSVYTGIIYNDFFSKMMWVFPSGWRFPTEYFEGMLLLVCACVCFKLLKSQYFDKPSPRAPTCCSPRCTVIDCWSQSDLWMT